MVRIGFLFLLLALTGLSAFSSEKSLPLWEYGAGFGFVRYQHYPASDQHNELYLPFPTFQYRGEILRADDQEGASVYFLKQSDWSVELSGGGYLPVQSSENEARRDMEDLPLVLLLGPQLVYKPAKYWELSLNFFQSVSADSFFIKNNGVYLEGRAYYYWENENWRGQLGVGLAGASKEFMRTYYEVNQRDVRQDRPQYFARAGFLNADLTYFHSVFYKDWSFYLGAALMSYVNSSNRSSPLYKADHSVDTLIGLTYTIGKSKSPAIKPEEAKGMIPPREGGYFPYPF